MTKATQALYEWFEQFGLPVYLDGDAPDEAQTPYITIPLKEPNWRNRTSFQFNIWYRTTSNVSPLAKADEISAVVHEGVRIYFDGGLLVLNVDENTPTQIMVDDDYRGARVSFVLNSYHVPGI